MGKRSKIAQEAFDIAYPLAEQMGYDLVDAEYKKEGKDVFLRLFIDKRGGVSIDDCEAFTRAVDPVFDEKLKHDADYFEVSSPGLLRPLETMSDYLRYMDETLEISLFAEKDGLKQFNGKTVDADESGVTLEIEGGGEIRLEYKEIAKAVRHIEF